MFAASSPRVIRPAPQVLSALHSARRDDRPHFRADVEGLRAVAILLVVAFHAIPGASGGFIGVDVFFVVSGYLITGLLRREFEETGRLDLAKFYGRRARRLLPAAALMILVTVAAARAVYSPLEQTLFASTAVTTALYSSNLWFAHSATDYLGAAADENPLLHTWSLAVEEQFYLVWPLMMIVAMRIGTKRRTALAATISVVGVVSFGVSLWLTHVVQPWAFFGPFSRAWEFAIGGLASVVPIRWLAPTPWRARGMMFVGVLAIVVGGCVLTRRTPFPGYAALIPTVGTVMALVGGAAVPGGFVAELLASRPMQWTGQRSYSWYLWHWPVLVIADAVFGPLSVPTRVCLAAAALVLAAATYALLENPVRKNGWLGARAALSVGLAGIVTLFVSGTAYLWHSIARSEARSHLQQRFTLAADDAPRINGGCHLPLMEVHSPDCEFGELRGDSTMVLFGDSHAAQWFPALEVIAIRRRWRLVSLTKSGCPAAEVQIFVERLARPYDECATWRHQTLARIVSMRPSLVVIANASGYIGAPDGTVFGLPITRADWESGLRHTVATLAGGGTQVAIVNDSPWPGMNVPVCLARAAWRHQAPENACDFVRARAIDTTGASVDRRIAASIPGATLIDMSDAICPEARCRTLQRGMVVYKDRNHLTAHFAQSLAPTLERRIDLATGTERKASSEPSRTANKRPEKIKGP